MRAKKSLGQHFLNSLAVLETMIQAAQVTKNDTVLEIGPGKGVLTRALLDTGAHVVAVETDDDLISLLTGYFAKEVETGQFVLLHEDVRTMSVDRHIHGQYKLVANIPYYITGEIIRMFLETDTHPRSMTLLVQKEVAERIARSKKESILSLSVKAYGTPRYVETVPARYFNPPPKVDSAILHVADISKDFFSDLSEKDFFRVVKIGFSQKRKKLTNNLSALAPKERVLDALTAVGLSPDIRAEDVPLEKWNELARGLL